MTASILRGSSRFFAALIFSIFFISFKAHSQTGCDCSTGIFNIGTPQSSTTSLKNWILTHPGFPSNGILNGCLRIYGQLTIDTDTPYSFDNSEITLMPQASITIPAYKRLNIQNGTKVHGCSSAGFLWGYIQVEPKGVLNVQNSSIANGTNAILCIKGSQLDVLGTEFRDNYIGIDIAGKITQTQPITGCKFYGGPIWPNLDGLSNAGTAFIGISIQNTISPRVNYCQFLDRLRYGIYTDKPGGSGAGPGGAIVSNSLFFNEVESGIFSFFSGQFIIDRCRFTGSPIGIHLYNDGNLIVKNSAFVTDEGIVTSKAGHEILNNSFDCRTGGIYMEVNELATIEGNYFRSNFPIRSFYPTAQSKLFIKNNPDILTTNSGIGVEISNGIFNAKNVIRDNHFRGLDIFSSATGVQFSNLSLGPQVVQNTFSSLEVGSKTSMTTNSLFCCNTFSTCNNAGMEFQMQSPSKVFHSSFAYNNTRGLYQFESSFIGQQLNRGNNWNPPFGILLGNTYIDDFGAPNDQTDIAKNRFRIDPDFYPSNTPSDNGPVGWLVDFGMDQDCSQYDPSDPPAEYCGESAFDDFVEEPPTEIELAFAQNLTDLSERDRLVQWLFQEQLYGKLYRNPQFHATNTSLNSFFTEKSTSTLGKLFLIEQGIGSLFDAGSANAQTIRMAESDIASAQEQILLLDSLLRGELTTADSLLFEADLQSKLQTLDHQAQIVDSLHALMKPLRLAQAAQLLVDNENIPTNDVWEANQKAINSIFLQTLAVDVFEFNDAQKLIVESITAQCPDEGGRAVYLARSLRQKWTKETSQDCSWAFQPAVDRSTVQPANENRVVSPNPASEQIVFEFDNAAQSSALISVFDASTSLKAAFRAYGPKAELDVSQYPNGIYFYRIQPAFERATFGKFIVQH